MAKIERMFNDPQFAGFERVVNNGDSHVDLEFLQSPVTLVPGTKPLLFPCQGRFDGHRSAGDGTARSILRRNDAGAEWRK